MAGSLTHESSNDFLFVAYNFKYRQSRIIFIGMSIAWKNKLSVWSFDRPLCQNIENIL